MFLGGSRKRRCRPRQLQLLLPAPVSPIGQARRSAPTGGGGGRGRTGADGRGPGSDGISPAGYWWEVRGVRPGVSPSGGGENTPVTTSEA